MAIEQQLDQDEQNQQTQQTGGTNQEQQLGTGVSEAGQANTSGLPTQPRSSQQPKGSGRFSNLKNYINANKDYNAAGGGISGKIQEQGSQRLSNIRQGIEASKNQVQNQSNQLRDTFGTQGEQLQQQAFQDPNAILQNQPQLDQFQKLRNGGYTGDIQNLGNDNNKFAQNIQGLQQQAQDAGTEQGRFGLLRSRFSQPGYSTGQQRLDQLLLQATPGSARSLRSGLQDMAQQATGLQTDLQGQVSSQQQELGNLAQTRQDSINNLLRGGMDQGLEGELGQRGYEDIQNDLSSRLEQLKTSAPEQYAQSLAALQNNTGSENVDLNKLTGLGEAENIYNLDLSKYLSSQDAVNAQLAGANRDQLLTQPEYQRLAGLSQLANIQGPSIDAEQVGKFNPYEFNKDQFLTDQSQRKTKVDDLSSKVSSSLDRILGGSGATGKNHGAVDALNFWNNQGWGDRANTKQLQQFVNIADTYKQNPSAENLKKVIDAHAAMKKTFSSYAGGFVSNPELYNDLYDLSPELMQYDPTRRLGNNPINGKGYTPTQNETTGGNDFGYTPVKGK